MQEGQDSKEEDDDEEDGEKPGPERTAKAASATAKAAAEQREAPPPKAKAGDPASGGTLTEKEGRSTGAHAQTPHHSQGFLPMRPGANLLSIASAWYNTGF